jgi:FtsH-binding integral membrane protein
MTEFDKLDVNKDNLVSRDEFALLELENRRRVLDDEDSKRDMQRAVVYFCLAGMLLYPFSIIVTAWIGLSEATSALSQIAGIYFVSVAGIVGVFFASTNMGKSNVKHSE